MGSAELGANIFRISQTEDLLKKQSEPSEQVATTTHYNVGRIVRKSNKGNGWYYARRLSDSRKKSFKTVRKKERKRLLIENKKRKMIKQVTYCFKA
ncbi:MAG: DNA-damage-inducible protein D [Clostridium sp.]|nr:MAG: DNA-damage-inducible protein D [Clostridium sp.]